jgi:hypothetical protein
VDFGSMTLGSIVWGQAAEALGISAALSTAAGGALLGSVVVRKRQLETGGQLDLAPSAHWPQPLVGAEVAHDAGPVMVIVEYQVDPARAEQFTTVMSGVERERRRNGAFAWGLYQDATDPTRFIEYFLEESWLEHLRHHERVTLADRDLQGEVHEFHVGAEPPKVSHYFTAGTGGAKKARPLTPL